MGKNFVDRVLDAPFGTRLLTFGNIVLLVILATSCGLSFVAGFGTLGWMESNGFMLSMILVFVVMSLFSAAIFQHR